MAAAPGCGAESTYRKPHARLTRLHLVSNTPSTSAAERRPARRSDVRFGAWHEYDTHLAPCRIGAWHGNDTAPRPLPALDVSVEVPVANWPTPVPSLAGVCEERDFGGAAFHARFGAWHRNADPGTVPRVVFAVRCCPRVFCDRFPGSDRPLSRVWMGSSAIGRVDDEAFRSLAKGGFCGGAARISACLEGTERTLRLRPAEVVPPARRRSTLRTALPQCGRRDRKPVIWSDLLASSATGNTRHSRHWRSRRLSKGQEISLAPNHVRRAPLALHPPRRVQSRPVRVGRPGAPPATSRERELRPRQPDAVEQAPEAVHASVPDSARRDAGLGARRRGLLSHLRSRRRKARSCRATRRPSGRTTASFPGPTFMIAAGPEDARCGSSTSCR